MRADSVKPKTRAKHTRPHRSPWIVGFVQRATGVVERAVVVTVNVAVTASVPFGVTEAGEIVQVAALGAPEQVSATLCLNPPAGVILSFVLTEPPAVTLMALLARRDSGKR